MPKKRKSSGRSKGGKGRSDRVQCTNCGNMVPRDKAKRSSRYVSLVDHMLAKELRNQGAQIARQKVVNYYCVSCAVHFKVVRVRSKDSRRTPKARL